MALRFLIICLILFLNIYFSAGYFFVRTEETLFTIDMINERIVEEWNCLCEDLKE